MDSKESEIAKSDKQDFDIEGHWFIPVLSQQKRTLGVKGINILKRYFEQSDDDGKRLLIRRLESGGELYTCVRAFRLMLLDIKLKIVFDFPGNTLGLTPGELRYIDRQMIRMTRLSVKV